MTETSRLIDTLNPEQRAAALKLTGPLRVFATAGAGKTTTNVAALELAIAQKFCAPWGIYAFTFRRALADDWQRRVAATVGRATARRMNIGTVHGIANRLLRRHPAIADLDDNFAILDADQAEAVLKDELRAGGARTIGAGTIGVRAVLKEARLFSRVARHLGDIKNHALLPSDAAAYLPIAAATALAKGLDPGEDAGLAELAVRAYPGYQSRLNRENACDFADLILWPTTAMRDDDGFRQRIARDVDLVRFDEYQDASYLHALFADLLASVSRNIGVCGDDDQAIYGFAGASRAFLVDFKQRWPDCADYYLERNYRSDPPILDAANAVIDGTPGRVPKRLIPRLLSPETTAGATPESVGGTTPETVGGTIGSRQYLPVLAITLPDRWAMAHWIARQCRVFAQEPRIGSIYIAVRARAEARRIEEMLIRERVDYVLEGQPSFWGGAIVRDLIAYAVLFEGSRSGFEGSGSGFEGSGSGRQQLVQAGVPASLRQPLPDATAGTAAMGDPTALPNPQPPTAGMPGVDETERRPDQHRPDAADLDAADIDAGHAKAGDTEMGDHVVAAWERIANRPERGLGASSLDAIHATWSKNHSLDLIGAGVVTPELRRAGRDGALALAALRDQWHAAAAAPLHERFEALVTESGYRDWLLDGDSKRSGQAAPDASSADDLADGDNGAADRVARLDELLALLEEARFDSLAEFLDHAERGQAAVDQRDARVRVMTLHGAKGREADIVFLPAWNEPGLPTTKALEAEARGFTDALVDEANLAYVGLTRARRLAVICLTAADNPSRFLVKLRAAAADGALGEPGLLEADAERPRRGPRGRDVFKPTKDDLELLLAWRQAEAGTLGRTSDDDGRVGAGRVGTPDGDNTGATNPGANPTGAIDAGQLNRIDRNPPSAQPSPDGTFRHLSPPRLRRATSGKVQP